MNPKIKAALKKKRPESFVSAVMATFPYHEPKDFEHLSDDGKLAVCCCCFMMDMFSGGYTYVLENETDWLDEVTKSLRRIGASPYANTLKRIIRQAKAEGFVLSRSADMGEFLEKHHYFGRETKRDWKDVPEVIAQCLRDHIMANASTFGMHRRLPKKAA